MVSRQEHRRSTLRRLSAATTQAFEDLGPTATFDDIAERAGVSRRTIFRYVRNKEELAFIHPILWLEIFDDAVAEVAELPLRERLMHGATTLSHHIDADSESIRRAMAVAMADPRLMHGYAGITRRWIDRIAREVRGEATDADTVFRAGVLGAAVMGVIDAALNEWFISDPAPPLVELVERGLDYLAPIFD